MYLHITFHFSLKRSDVKDIHLLNPDRVWDLLTSTNTHKTYNSDSDATPQTLTPFICNYIRITDEQAWGKISRFPPKLSDCLSPGLQESDHLLKTAEH